MAPHRRHIRGPSIQEPQTEQKTEIEAGFAKDIAQPKSIYQFLMGLLRKVVFCLC
jgi:hypothetical protein